MEPEDERLQTGHLMLGSSLKETVPLLDCNPSQEISPLVPLNS